MTNSSRSLLALAGFLVLAFAASAIGGLATYPAIPDWYQNLEKPSWTPPDAVFGPVWTVLYVFMAVAAWLVWKRGGWAAHRVPLILWIVQLVLNSLWSILFFGMRNPGLGLVEIGILWLAILATLIAFWKVSHPAGWLMVPYLAWVSYASALNFAIWSLNS